MAKLKEELCEMNIYEFEKKKEDILFEYLKDTKRKSRQILNDIWLYYFYNNISMLIKKIRELDRDYANDLMRHKKADKIDKSAMNNFFVTLNINIKSAYEYFDNLSYSIKMAYDYSKHNFIMYVNNVKYKQSDNHYYNLINRSKESCKFILENSIVEFDNHMNNIVDNYYADEKERNRTKNMMNNIGDHKYKKKQRKKKENENENEKEKEKEKKKKKKKNKKKTSFEEMKQLYENLENARICVGNTFRILGDLFRYKSCYFSEKKKENMLLACINYYRSLNYFKFNGYVMNQLSLLYANTNPIKGLFFYLLSLVSFNPAPNRDAFVMFLERILKEGKCLVEKIMEEKRMAGKSKISKDSCNSFNRNANRNSRYSYSYNNKYRETNPISFKDYKNTIRNIYNNEEYFGNYGGSNNAHVSKSSFNCKRSANSFYMHKNKDGDIDQDLADKELKLTLVQLYVSYFKIVRLLFSRIDMNKFEKKKNKLLYYTNKYVKIQFYNNKGEDKLLFRSICIIIFTLLSIVLYTIVHKYETDRNKYGFFFYGDIEISKYVYKNEQIYFSFLLIYDILVACKSFYYDFYSEYLSVFVYVLYWLNNEKRIRPVHFKELSVEEGKERMKLIKHYYQDYKKKAMYIDANSIVKEKCGIIEKRKKKSEVDEETSSVVDGKNKKELGEGTSSNSVKNENIDYTDIIQNIYDLINSVEIKNKKKLDDTLLTYKLKEDFCLYPFLNVLTFERFIKKYNTQKKEHAADESRKNYRSYKMENTKKKENNAKINSSKVDREGNWGEASSGKDSNETNEEDIVILNKPLFERANCYNENIKNKDEQFSKVLYKDNVHNQINKLGLMDDWIHLKDSQKNLKSYNNMYEHINEDANNSESNSIDDIKKNDVPKNEEENKSERRYYVKDNSFKEYNEMADNFSSLFDFYMRETNFVIPSKHTEGDEELEDLVREARFFSLMKSERNACDQHRVGIHIFRQPLTNANSNEKAKEKMKGQEDEDHEKEEEEEEEEEYDEDEDEKGEIYIVDDRENKSENEKENSLLNSKEIPNEDFAEHFVSCSNGILESPSWDLCEIDEEGKKKNERQIKYTKKKSKHDYSFEKKNDSKRRKQYHKSKAYYEHNNMYDKNNSLKNTVFPKSSSNKKHLKLKKRISTFNRSKGKTTTSESRSGGLTIDSSGISSSYISYSSSSDSRSNGASSGSTSSIISSSSNSSNNSSSSNSSFTSEDTKYKKKKKKGENENSKNVRRKKSPLDNRQAEKIEINKYKNLNKIKEDTEKELPNMQLTDNSGVHAIKNENLAYELKNDEMYNCLYANNDNRKEKINSKSSSNNLAQKSDDDGKNNKNSGQNEVLDNERQHYYQQNSGNAEFTNVFQMKFANKSSNAGEMLERNGKVQLDTQIRCSEINKENNLINFMERPLINFKRELLFSSGTECSNQKRKQNEQKASFKSDEYDMERKVVEQMKYEVKKIYTDFILIDGINMGNERIKGLKPKFNIFRIKMALDYYKSQNKNFNVKIVMPREYLIGWNFFGINNKNSNYNNINNNNANNNNNNDANNIQNKNGCIHNGNMCVNDSNKNRVNEVDNESSSEFVELTNNDLLFFKHLNILDLLIVQPLSSYYSYCVQYITNNKSCLVTNSTFYNSISLNIFEYIVPYAFNEREFLPGAHILPSRLKCEGYTKRECYEE